MKKLLSGLLLVWVIATPSFAAIEALEFIDKETEEDYKELIKELRCLVCQNQNLADSDAPLAKDLRTQTYDMLQQGKSREEVVDYMVDRYGNFVLYNPPLENSTLLLWGGPFALLVIVLLVVIVRIRNTRSVEAPPQDGMEMAKHILEDDDRETGTDGGETK